MPDFIYIIEPAREDFLPENATTEEYEHIAKHWEYLVHHNGTGCVKFVGRTTSSPFTGLAVYEAKDQGDAQAFFDNDPAVKNGVFSGRVQPFTVAIPFG